MPKWLMRLLLAVPVGLFIYNFVRAVDKYVFFEMPLYWIISLTITIYVVYWWTQKNIDKRRAIDFVSTALERSIAVLTDSRMYVFSQAHPKDSYGYIQHNILSKRLRLLEGYLSKTKFKNMSKFNDAKRYLEEWWDIYNEVMGNEELRAQHEWKMKMKLQHCVESLECVQASMLGLS